MKAATAALNDPDGAVQATHEKQMLNNNHPDFWAMCFLDLFPRGDCQERTPRTRRLARFNPEEAWAQCLMERGDHMRWRRSLEFVATCYNVLLRRNQLNVIGLYVRHHGDAVSKDFRFHAP